jgi:hypothetical protein
MTTYFPLLLTGFAALVLGASFYWSVVRPVFVTKINYRLFARRDELRQMAIEGTISHHSDDYLEVENFICKTIDLRSRLTLGSFILDSIFHRDEIEAAEVVEPSCEETARMRGKTVHDAVCLMLLNSPFIASLMTLVVMGLRISGKFNSGQVLQNAENYVDRLPTPPHGLHWA